MRSRFPAVAGIFLSVLVVSGALAGPHIRSRTFDGSGADNLFGLYVAPAGDVNADGHPDVIVGAPGADTAKVYSGANGSVLYAKSGTSTGDSFGFAVAGVGDVDDDGYDDFAVGAQKGDYVRVYSGQDGSILRAFTGVAGGDEFGYSVAGVGDLSGDGMAEVAVGAPLAYDVSGNQVGTVTIFASEDGSVIHTFYGDAYYDCLGDSVSSAGDADGDGTPDIVAGASWGTSSDGQTYPGFARIYSGTDGSTIYTWYGPSDSSLFGFSVAAAGDLDGDGADDIVVGAPLDDGTGTTDCGSAWLLTGFGDMLAYAEGDADYDQFGYSVAAGGDIDGDGSGDSIVGANLAYDSNQYVTGIVRAFSGADGSELWTLEGPNDQMYFGESVAFAGDWNGDGLADIIIGAPGNDVGALTDAGSAYVYVSPSPTGTVLINGGAQATTSISVTLSIAWQAGSATVTDMRLRGSGASWGGWQSLASSVAWVLTAVEAEHTVEVQFRDADGYLSGPKSDTIFYDVSAPYDCSIALAGGAPWTNSATVPVTLAGADASSGLAQVHFRNQGGAWSAWVDVGPSVTHTMTAGAGSKTVEAEFRDFAGNVSGVVSDSIGVDLTVPSITSFVVNDGDAFTGWLQASLSITAVDSGGSGLSQMRFRKTGETTFGAWEAFSTSPELRLIAGDGAKNVEAQVRDGAGNVFGTASDMITLDQAGPIVTGFTVNGGRPYVAPEEGVSIAVTLTDAGSGPETFSVTYDNGSTFSAWLPATAGAVSVVRPEITGSVPVRVRARDVVGNVSVLSTTKTVCFLEPDPPYLGTGGGYAGSISGRQDVDAVGLDLVEGDSLAVKVKAAGTNRKAGFPLVCDLVNPDGTLILAGVTAVAGHVVTYTGRHLLVLRLADDTGSETGTYALSVKVKLGAANAKGKGSFAGSFTFEAAEGGLISVSLKGAGLDPGSVVIEGPDGDVAAAVSGKPGSAKLAATLDRGTGTYTVSFTATGQVSASFGVKLPKGPSLTEL
jgi:hypothetical protein